MKKLIITIISLFLFNIVISQDIYKFKTTGSSYSYLIEDTLWSNWSEWKEAKILITLNKEKIVIYSASRQTYYVDEGEILTEEDGESIVLYCTNYYGSECTILFILTNTEYVQLLIIYEKYKLVYDIYQI